ncbi:MAG TPA: DUF4294 domain-containing protein [Bacteroidia bacterium]|nr:DUF4294 domain-containing protein [Bacteroidia bacterium]
MLVWILHIYSTLLPALITAFFSISTGLLAQDLRYDITQSPPKGLRLRAEILNQDTLPVVDLGCVDVCARPLFSSRRQYEIWTRLKYNVKVVYPYAILASAKLKEYDKVLEHLQDKNLKKAFTRQCELDLRAQFEKELRALTVNQGRLLMKLIDRETGKTTFQIVKEMRGGFKAGMCQAIALVFGHNMKVEFGKESEDLMVEKAIKAVESGFF